MVEKKERNECLNTESRCSPDTDTYIIQVHTEQKDPEHESQTYATQLYYGHRYRCCCVFFYHKINENDVRNEKPRKYVLSERSDTVSVIVGLFSIDIT